MARTVKPDWARLRREAVDVEVMPQPPVMIDEDLRRHQRNGLLGAIALLVVFLWSLWSGLPEAPAYAFVAAVNFAILLVVDFWYLPRRLARLAEQAHRSPAHSPSL
jgi:hypothetical protein